MVFRIADTQLFVDMSVSMKCLRGVVHCVVEDKLYIATGPLEESVEWNVRELSTSRVFQYEPLYDDFGPLKLSQVIRFCQRMDNEMSNFPDARIVIYADEGNARELANAAFLLGSYLIIKFKTSADNLRKCFSWADDSVFEPYRDASDGECDFFIHLNDCWRAVEKARLREWIRYGGRSGTWGEYNVNEYEHYDNVANGRLHVIIPGKLVAFQGPKNLRGSKYLDIQGRRHFSPSYYCDIFHAMGVASVVRLSDDALYDPSDFEDEGFEHHHLPWPADSPAPPDEVAHAFLRLARARRRGLLAVHCTDGLGRTGALAARFLVRAHGFTAREALAWVRIARPGSASGPHQGCLADYERDVAALAAAAAGVELAPDPAARQPAMPPPVPRPAFHHGGGGGDARGRAPAADPDRQEAASRPRAASPVTMAPAAPAAPSSTSPTGEDSEEAAAAAAAASRSLSTSPPRVLPPPGAALSRRSSLTPGGTLSPLFWGGGASRRRMSVSPPPRGGSERRASGVGGGGWALGRCEARPHAAAAAAAAAGCWGDDPATARLEEAADVAAAAAAAGRAARIQSSMWAGAASSGYRAVSPVGSWRLAPPGLF